MTTANHEILNTNFEMLSTQGQAGSGSGNAYVPLRSGLCDDFMIGQLYPYSPNTIVGFSSNTLSSTNDFIFATFLPSENIQVNRLILRVGAVTSPVMTVRGGIMPLDLGTGYPLQTSNVVAFVPGASQDISTATSFTINTYTQFSFASTITLQANTWYCAGLTISSYTSGALSFNNSQTNSWFATMKWPQSGYRAPSGTGAFQTAGNYGVGFNNGTSTQMLFGFLHDAATGLAIYTNSTTNTQVGFRFELNLPVDDIFINKILIGQTSINTTQSVVLKIYSDIAGSKLIGSSTVINSTNLVTGALVRPRYYFFAPPVRVKPYKQYFAMMEIVAGTATTSGTSFMSMIGIENRDYYPYDSNNIVAYRANLANANFTYNTGFIAPAIIHYNVSKKAPRPKSSNM